MLKHLLIKNFALVESLDIDLAGGMSVLTGETGAGKSILLGALGLALGDRADTSVVRHGAERAEVSASFDCAALPRSRAWLAERELEADDEIIIRRTVGADGRSRGYINGQPMPVQALRELGEQLVDIHGQHAHQSLLRKEVQRELLDAYGALSKQASGVATAYHHWHALQRELERLTQAASDRDARLELLRYQVEELESLNLSVDELSALDEEHARLANAGKLMEGAQRAAQVLYEGDEGAVADLLQRTLVELQELTETDPKLATAAELVEGAAIQAAEAASELRHYQDQVELDPQRLAEVEERLGLIHELSRKHQRPAEELPELLLELSDELQTLQQAGERLDGLEAEIAAARTDYEQQAAKLSKGRAKAATELAERVEANMQELGMGGGRLVIELKPLEEPSVHGLEAVELQVSANPGQPPRPLAKVASGGELSRISLAIAVITAGQEGIPTLIFDEVDVGVGGGVAEMVGRQLRSLAGSRQVLCVTHQPQVASQGHHHYRIQKQSDGEQTRTGVEPLDKDGRVEEIARMLGGVEITEQSRSHAWEMLALAK